MKSHDTKDQAKPLSGFLFIFNYVYVNYLYVCMCEGYVYNSTGVRGGQRDWIPSSFNYSHCELPDRSAGIIRSSIRALWNC